MGYTTPAEFEDAYSTLFRTFATGRTKDLKWRKWQLKQCWWLIHENETVIVDALHADLHRPAFEAYAYDIKGMKDDLLDTIANLEKWTADEPIDAGFVFGTIGGARIRKEPLGVTLIIGAWNFPWILLLQPMFAAIAAGCCIMLKPSEVSSATEKAVKELVPKYLDQSAVRVVTGGSTDMANILEHRFNHIFFTGSNTIARYITAAAAKHLTPTVLELGGQGPAIVTASADIDLAAKRIASSKYSNAGQVCLSTNHVFVDPKVHDEFVKRVGYWYDTFLGGSNKDFTRIINERNYDRLMKQLDGTKGKVVYTGNLSRADKHIHPTIVVDVKLTDSLMSEELFGPILPVIKADYLTAIEMISSMEHPLVLYIFSRDQTQIDTIIQNTNSGGVTINDTMIHAIVPGAPFGGVGESGMGYYHGPHGVAAFTHQRTIVALPTWFDKFMAARYPPYNMAKSELVKNSLGFKKGETMADQKIVTPRNWHLATWVVAASLVLNAWVLVGERKRIGEVLKGVFGGVKGKTS